MTELLSLTSKIVCAYISRNAVPPKELPDVIRSVCATLYGLTHDAAEDRTTTNPAVPISSSITPDYLVCLEDGARLKMLKRYLKNRHDMTPEEYRRKWGLSPSYPMMAPSYAARRSELAKQIGLGNRLPRKIPVRRPARR